MKLDSPELITARLKAANAWSQKELGQHFLWDYSVLENILEAANLTKVDTVVEIGPGLGVLSRELLDRAGNVVAFEYDDTMIRILRNDLPELTVVAGDVLRTAPERLEALGTYKLVANIPYQITTPLLRLFLEGQYPPQSLTLLVQKEVGKRLCASAATSERSYLSVLCEYFSETRYVSTVPAGAFFPPPNVESAVIHLETRLRRAFEGEEERQFLRFVRILFTNRRKQLKNVVAGIQGISSAEVDARFQRLGLPSTVRAQELTLPQWVLLFKGGSNG